MNTKLFLGRLLGLVFFFFLGRGTHSAVGVDDFLAARSKDLAETERNTEQKSQRRRKKDHEREREREREREI